MTCLKLFLIFFLSSAAVVVIPWSGHCYVGPGAGITLIGSLWAILVAIVLALSGILVWPIRRLLRRRGQPRRLGRSRAALRRGQDHRRHRRHLARPTMQPGADHQPGSARISSPPAGAVAGSSSAAAGCPGDAYLDGKAGYHF